MKRMCQLIVSISRDAGRSAIVAFDLILIRTDSRRAAEAVFDLVSTWTFTQCEDDWQAGRRARGRGCRGVEQGELSLDMCVTVTAGWKRAADTQSGAVSRLAGFMIRAG